MYTINSDEYLLGEAGDPEPREPQARSGKVRYTYQTFTEGGSYSDPCGNDVNYASSRKELAQALQAWCDEVSRFSEDRCYLRAWVGQEEDVTDLYPDLEATLGPRGGVRFHRC